VLELIDATAPARRASAVASDPNWRQRIGSHATVLLVANKVDLSGDVAGLRDGRLYASAKTGAGLNALRAELLRRAGWEHAPSDEGVYLARARHLDAIARTQHHLQECANHLQQGALQPELAAEELRLAGLALGEITGQVSADDVLGEIFSRFCIGK
jgi:tRNA modification GTPase